MSFPAANHDADVFSQPDDFVFDRKEKSHLAFGAGVHHCLGAGMARYELRIALEEWHRRIPEYEIVDETALQWRGGQNHVLRSLPLRWATLPG
jgi:cytochrome P450